MFEWIRAHETVLGWLGALSALVFVGSLLAVPWLIVRIPSDYFLRQRHYVDRLGPRHLAWRVAYLAVKNLLGALLVLAGAAMLILPGQGILTILVGLICLDFPGKFALERCLVRIPPVIASINWMRGKAGREALKLPEKV